MSMSVAELYMLALRKSMVPILGEAVPFPFDFQIELDSWSWTLSPPEKDDEEKKDAETKEDKKEEEKPGPTFDGAKAKREDDEIYKAIEQVMRTNKAPQVDRDKAVLKK